MNTRENMRISTFIRRDSLLDKSVSPNSTTGGAKIRRSAVITEETPTASGPGSWTSVIFIIFVIRVRNKRAITNNKIGVQCNDFQISVTCVCVRRVVRPRNILEFRAFSAENYFSSTNKGALCDRRRFQVGPPCVVIYRHSTCPTPALIASTHNKYKCIYFFYMYRLDCTWIDPVAPDTIRIIFRGRYTPEPGPVPNSQNLGLRKLS